MRSGSAKALNKAVPMSMLTLRRSITANHHNLHFRLPRLRKNKKERPDRTMVAENIEADTRARILVVAERLFREIGYQKTTVADIAKMLRMSPANVYRFFDSKKA